MLIEIILAVSTASSTQSSAPTFTLTLGAEDNLVKAGSEVKVDITLRNSSNRAMHIGYGANPKMGERNADRKTKTHPQKPEGGTLRRNKIRKNLTQTRQIQRS